MIAMSRSTIELQAQRQHFNYKIFGYDILNASVIIMIQQPFDHYLHQKIVSNIPLFQHVKKTHGINVYNVFIRNTIIERHTKDSKVYESSNNSRRFVYVLSGSVLITYFQNKEDQQNSQDEKLLNSKIMKPADYFGNTNQIQQATTTSQSILITLSIQNMYLTFHNILYFPEIESRIRLFQLCTVFKNIDQHQLHRLACMAEQIKIKKNVCIYQQDKRADLAYVVVSGKFELLRRIETDLHYKDILILHIGSGQTLGAEECLFQQNYNDSAYCVSLSGQLLKIQKKDLIKSIDQQTKILNLCQQKSKWKDQRVQIFAKTGQINFGQVKKRRVMTSQPVKERRLKTEGDSIDHQSIFQILPRCESKPTSINNKERRRSPFKSDFQYFQYKVEQIEKRKSRLSKQVYEIQITKPESKEQKRSCLKMSQLLLKKFLSKKQKIENKAIMNYLKARPPEIVFDPQKQFCLMKPLHVKQSAAILNKKKTLNQIKQRYYKPIIPFENMTINSVLTPYSISTTFSKTQFSKTYNI